MCGRSPRWSHAFHGTSPSPCGDEQILATKHLLHAGGVVGNNGLDIGELGVRVRQAGACRSPLVDQPEGFSLLHDLGDERDFLVVQFGERADVPRRVDDDLLPLDRGVQVGDDADDPLVCAFG